MTGAGIRPALNGTDPELVWRTNIQSTETLMCDTCHQAKPPSEMAPDQSKKDGYRSQCRDCRKDYDRRRYEANRDAILAQQRVYRKAHPEIGWAADHRRRARSYGLQPVTETVTPDQLIAQWGNGCHYCEGPFEVIDHRIPVAAGGHHTVLNVVPCCRPCNEKKRVHSDLPMIRDFRQGQNGHGELATASCVHVGARQP
jgi:HNH endonuclease